MEVYGKVIELWLVDFHGFSWIFMDFHGFSWIFMDFHEFSWIFMDFPVCPGG